VVLLEKVRRRALREAGVDALRLSADRDALVQAEALGDEAATPTQEKLLAAAKAAGHEAFERKVAYLRDFAQQIGAVDVDGQVLSTVMLTVLAFNFVGDGLREWLDPKQKR
jgi:hypothetical protein